MRARILATATPGMPDFIELGICYLSDAPQGLAYLDDKLYTVDACSSKISVYYCVCSKISQESVGIQYLHQAKEEDIEVEDLIYASGLEACPSTCSLFVCDSGSACVFKVDLRSRHVEKLYFNANEKPLHLSIFRGKMVIPTFIQDGINFLEVYSTKTLEKIYRLELDKALWVHRVIFRPNENLLMCWTKDVRGHMAMLTELELGQGGKEEMIKSVDLGRFKYEFDLVELSDNKILLSDTCDNSVKMFTSDLIASEKVSCQEGLLKILQPSLMTTCRGSSRDEVIFLSQITPFRIAEEQHHVEHTKKFIHIIRILKIV